MSLGVGGAETHILELSLELASRGYEVHVASNGGLYVASLENAGIYHYQVPMHVRSIPSILKSFFVMRKLIKRLSPDVVHAHARIPGFICGLLHKLMRFTFVTTAHFDFEVGHGLRYLTNWGQKTLAVSDDIKNYLIDDYGLAPDDVIVTVNGVDTMRFSPAATKPEGEPSRPVIVSVSRMDDNAAFTARLLIDAAPQLHARIPGVQIVLVGDGNIYDELCKKAASVNEQTGSQTILMTGMRTDIEAILAKADLFVGVSRAALEALSEAVPVILSGNEGYLGLFTPEKEHIARATNFTCRNCGIPSQDLLIKEITDFFESVSGPERKELGDFGRRMVISDYSVKRMTDDCVAAYESASRRACRIVMSGYYGFKNAGDEAILQSVHQSLSAKQSDVSITVLSSDPADTRQRYKCNAIKRFSPRGVLKTIRESDILISGGGSLLQDVTSTRSLLYYLFIINTAVRKHKKVMLYSNGIGPIRKKRNRRRVARALSRTDVITLRDTASLEELRALGVMRSDVRVTADPVFSLRKPSNAEIAEAREKYELPAVPYLAVSLRTWAETDGFTRTIARLCDSVHDITGREIVFISMQSGKDDAVADEVRAMMKAPSYIVAGLPAADELMCIIGASDAVLGMRLHSLIFAARMGVPFAGLVYDPKVSAFLSAMSMPSAGDVAALDADFALTTIIQLFDCRSEYNEVLRQKSEALEKAAAEDPALLISLIEQ